MMPSAGRTYRATEETSTVAVVPRSTVLSSFPALGVFPLLCTVVATVPGTVAVDVVSTALATVVADRGDVATVGPLDPEEPDDWFPGADVTAPALVDELVGTDVVEAVLVLVAVAGVGTTPLRTCAAAFLAFVTRSADKGA
jgi:hypothetical protein